MQIWQQWSKIATDPIVPLLSTLALGILMVIVLSLIIQIERRLDDLSLSLKKEWRYAKALILLIYLATSSALLTTELFIQSLTSPCFFITYPFTSGVLLAGLFILCRARRFLNCQHKPVAQGNRFFCAECRTPLTREEYNTILTREEVC